MGGFLTISPNLGDFPGQLANPFELGILEEEGWDQGVFRKRYLNQNLDVGSVLLDFSWFDLDIEVGDTNGPQDLGCCRFDFFFIRSGNDTHAGPLIGRTLSGVQQHVGVGNFITAEQHHQQERQTKSNFDTQSASSRAI